MKGYNIFTCGGHRNKPGSRSSVRAFVTSAHTLSADGGGTIQTVMVWCFGGGGDLLSFESFLLLVSNSSASVESILIADRDPEENDAGHKPKLIGVNCVECDCRRKLRVNKDVRENEKTRLKIPNTGIMRKSRLHAALGMVPCPSLCSSPN
jgi:hypothetical protein